MASSPECANPLFLKWIGEWLDNAKQHNSKGVTTYKKAYQSMKACPLPFSHPNEALQLHGLGPKLCDRLAEKLKAHCAEQGLPMPDIPQKGRKHTAENGGASGPTKKARKPKPYVPTLRSGAYAILLALSTLPEDSSKSLSKAEVIELAQPHCDSSLTAPSDPTKFFTAWNSIKTLLDKDLVFERGRPLRRYAMTEDGWEVAKRIRKSIGGESSVLESFVDSATVDAGTVDAGTRAPRYRSPSGPSTVEESGAWVGSGPSRRWIDNDTEGQLGTWAPSRVYSNPNEAVNAQSRPDPRRNNLEWSSSQQCSVSSLGRQDHTNIPSRGTKASARSDYVDLLSSSSEPDEPLRLVPNQRGDPSTLTDHASGTLLPVEGQRAQNVDEAPLSFTPVPIATGTFTVQLVLDTREVRAKQDRDYIQNELTKKGVKPIMRSLELGDALWVAKCHDATQILQRGEEGDEVVLDWIVERKRLDDLVGSIKDGRFQEQKFRLRKAGVKNVIYIIEETSLSADDASKYQAAVESAIASTQVVNGYFVKKTQKLDDTIRYLARMTMVLKNTYECKPLAVIPTAALSPKTHLPLLAHLAATQPSKAFHITYPAFASLASKSDALTLRDVFLKMLMCTRGVTGERALEIQRRWATPRAFVDEYERCGGGEEGRRRKDELLFRTMGGLVGRNKVGKALSKKVADVWGHG